MRGYLTKKGVSNNVRHGPELKSFLVVGSKKSFGGGNCFNKIRIFLNIVLQFLSPLVLHPGPNHNPIRHLAQLTTSSPKFLSLCIQVIILSLFSSLMGPFVPFPCAGSPYFFQTTKCFRCHSVSVIGHFLSFVLLL